MEKKTKERQENNILGDKEPNDMERLDKHNYMEVLREEVEYHLKINKISPEDFAKRCGVTGRTIYGILKQETGDVMAGNLFAILEAVYANVTVSRPSRK